MTKALGGRPSREAALQIETKIVDTARQLFFAHGYGATSIESIANTAGISKRTFYHRFENKAAIFTAVVAELIGRLAPGGSAGLFTGGSCEEILQNLAGVLLQASLTPDSLALQRVLIAEATRFPELALVMSRQGARREAIDRIAALLASEVTAGRLDIEDCPIAAEMFLQLVAGIPQRRALGLGEPMTKAELESWARRAVHLFLNGCRA